MLMKLVGRELVGRCTGLAWLAIYKPVQRAEEEWDKPVVYATSKPACHGQMSVNPSNFRTVLTGGPVPVTILDKVVLQHRRLDAIDDETEHTELSNNLLRFYGKIELPGRQMSYLIQWPLPC